MYYTFHNGKPEELQSRTKEHGRININRLTEAESFLLHALGEMGMATLPLDVLFSSIRYFVSSHYAQGTLLDSVHGI